MNRYLMIRRLRGPAFLLLLGICAMLHQLNMLSVWHAWPLFLILLCVVLGVPGCIGFALPYFVYKKMVQLRTGKVTPLIEQKYDAIYEICEKGNRLLS